MCVSVCVHLHRAAINNTPTPHKAPQKKEKADVENSEASREEQQYQSLIVVQNSVLLLISCTILEKVQTIAVARGTLKLLPIM